MFVMRFYPGKHSIRWVVCQRGRCTICPSACSECVSPYGIFFTADALQARCILEHVLCTHRPHGSFSTDAELTDRRGFQIFFVIRSTRETFS